MKRYLVFDLYGPLASWGDLAVGEQRPTRTVPTRSALLGLIAAALGIERANEERQQSLAAQVRVGAFVWRPGSSLRDYHTAQSPKGTRARDLASRRAELAYSSIHTILSSRDYLQDHLSTGIVPEPVDDKGDYALEVLARALNQPTFTLCLGRRSCPLGAPVNAQVVQAEGLLEVVRSHRPRITEFLSADRDFQGPMSGELWWDWHEPGLEETARHHRWDDVVSRARWQFRPRIVKQKWVDVGAAQPSPSSGEENVL